MNEFSAETPGPVEPTDQPARVGFAAVLMEQVRWVWARAWIWWLVLLGAMSLGLIAILWDVPARDDAARMIPILLGGTLMPLMLLIAASWGLTVWRDDPPRDRQYFWVQPVSRVTHTIARSLAGAIWIVLAVLLLIGVALVTAGVRGAPAPDAGVWLLWLGSVVLAYLITSAAAMLSDRPAVWLAGGTVLLLLVNALARARDILWLESVMKIFMDGDYSLSVALFAPSMRAIQNVASAGPHPGGSAASVEPAAALLIWLAVGVLAFLGSAWMARPR